MSDLGRYLPLSQGRSGDESTITGNWSGHAADSLDAIAGMLGTLRTEEWDLVVEPDGWRVAAAVGHLADRSSAAVRSPVAEAMRSAVMNDLTGLVAYEALVLMTPAGAAAVGRGLRTIATGFRTPAPEPEGRSRWTGRAKIRRESLRVLTDVVVTGYDIAVAVTRDLELPSVATGAVALARIGTAPADVRAVVRGRTIVAEDAGWSFGRGPELVGSASSIIRFLFERAGVPGSTPTR